MAESRKQSKELEQLLRKQNNDSTTAPPLRRLDDGAKQVRRIHYYVSNCLLFPTVYCFLFPTVYFQLFTYKKYVTDPTCPRNATTNN